MMIIAFVDQDENLIESLSASTGEVVPGTTQSWRWYFPNSATELLSLLESGGIDCVVSDMQVSGNDGAQLLTHIASLYPTTLRIAISGQVNAQMTLESLHATHRFIAKPTDAQTLVEAINRSLALHEAVSDQRLRGLIAGITALPVLPQIYNRLMSELASPDYSLEGIGSIIESDMSLSATLLKVVNSPYYGLVQHVESATHAAKLLGVELVKNILLCEKVLSQFDTSNTNESLIKDLNMAARIRGVLANRFARLATFNKHQIDHCQIAGMLSNLGELMVATSMVDPIVDDATQFLPDQIGGAVMALWSLPDPIVEAVVLQRSASALPGSLSPAHILHAVRGLEKHFEECAFEMGPEFSMLGALPDSSVAPDILEKWFNCFCDLHLDLQRAA